MQARDAPPLGPLALFAGPSCMCAQSAFINYRTSFRTAAWGEHRFLPQPFRLPWNSAFPFIYLLISVHTCRLELTWEDGAQKWIQLEANLSTFFLQTPTFSPGSFMQGVTLDAPALQALNRSVSTGESADIQSNFPCLHRLGPPRHLNIP